MIFNCCGYETSYSHLSLWLKLTEHKDEELPHQRFELYQQKRPESIKLNKILLNQTPSIK